MLYMLWVVLLSSALVGGFPSGEPAPQPEEGAGPADPQLTSVQQEQNKQEQSGASQHVKLQLAFLVEDQQYERAPSSDIIKSPSNKKASSYGRRRRRNAQHFYDSYFAATRAPATPAPLAENHDTTTAPQTTESASAPRDFGNIARILAIAGTKPKAVDLSGSYSGRKKRSDSNHAAVHPFDNSKGFYQYGLSQEEALTDPLVAQHAQAGAQRDFGDISRILAIAGTKPKAVDLSGSYSGRRKRSSHIVPSVNHARLDVSENHPHSGLKSELDDLTKHFRTVRKRSASGKSSDDLHGLVENVASKSVKIKSRGNYGKLARAGKKHNGRRIVFDADSSSQRRHKRGDNFIPFSVYDQRRVRTLKVEQNDFLALPKRLEQEARATIKLKSAAKR